ncbi:MAG: peptide chain release factor N(5)-glutamine methyltransferase [Firmicutes bacterium]|uniref:peptide chain release factor N(5)-glutamine methyltransferase n=1 Tax=Candidatus Alloenteromonas pullistercoris TaxID=2840785 RepID=A0A9D9DGF6_9FIRM|nr:peptide chain release factor N(5)-glutamine methyltransferase [Candidatus Enteromonas pullistercoris]
MAKVIDVYSKAVNEGKEAGVYSSDIRVLLAFDLGFATEIEVLLHKDDEMDEKKIQLFNAQLARLLNNEPVEYIVNECKFLEFKLFVDNRVLIPRMETQEMLAILSERILDYYDPRNYLVAADVGTGSGCLAIALKSYFPNWLVNASDISEKALEVAKINVDRHNTRVKLLQGDALTPYIEEKMKLDVIVCNPPYIASRERVQSSVKDFEPETALYLDKENSVYEKVFRDIGKVKKGSILLCFEIDDDIVSFLNGLIDRHIKPIYKAEIDYIKDMNGFDRFLFIYLE